MNALLSLVILTGALAAVRPNLFKEVELTRLAFGGELAGPGVVRLGIEDCDWLGKRGWVIVDGMGVYPAHVTDCQRAEDRAVQPMSKRGIAADTDAQWLNHRKAIVILR